ncbi:hypothetical protein MN608_05388 [Microdochium nivale]|nr:hypothetical protein MN608_05388 [Microdochium nivale]
MVDCCGTALEAECQQPLVPRSHQRLKTANTYHREQSTRMLHWCGQRHADKPIAQLAPLPRDQENHICISCCCLHAVGGSAETPQALIIKTSRTLTHELELVRAAERTALLRLAAARGGFFMLETQNYPM